MKGKLCEGATSVPWTADQDVEGKVNEGDLGSSPPSMEKEPQITLQQIFGSQVFMTVLQHFAQSYHPTLSFP